MLLYFLTSLIKFAGIWGRPYGAKVLLQTGKQRTWLGVFFPRKAPCSYKIKCKNNKRNEIIKIKGKINGEQEQKNTKVRFGFLKRTTKLTKL